MPGELVILKRRTAMLGFPANLTMSVTNPAFRSTAIGQVHTITSLFRSMPTEWTLVFKILLLLAPRIPTSRCPSPHPSIMENDAPCFCGTDLSYPC